MLSAREQGGTQPNSLISAVSGPPAALGQRPTTQCGFRGLPGPGPPCLTDLPLAGPTGPCVHPRSEQVPRRAPARPRPGKRPPLATVILGAPPRSPSLRRGPATSGPRASTLRGPASRHPSP